MLSGFGKPASGPALRWCLSLKIPGLILNYDRFSRLQKKAFRSLLALSVISPPEGEN